MSAHNVPAGNGEGGRLIAENVVLAKRIARVIENIPDDVWAEAEQEVSTLWRALDEIDAICVGALLNDGTVSVADPHTSSGEPA